MKKLFTLIILTLLFAACKTRHVATTKIDTKTSETLTRSVKKDSLKIDTGKIHAETKTVKDINGSATVTIIPDSGTVQTFHITPNQEFVYTGKAKSIVYHGNTTEHSVIDALLQIDKAEITSTTLADTLSDVKEIHQVNKVKTVDATVDHTWIWMLSIIGVLCVLIFISTKVKIT